MDAVDRRITDLTAEWMALIGSDHHKDRDCHFYIEKKWSYGEPPVYTVRHYGYVAEEFEREFEDYASAAAWLIDQLTEMVIEERRVQERWAQEGA